MPIYEYECQCGRVFEKVLPVSEYRSQQLCECNQPARRIISRIRAGFVQRECVYESPVDGRPITSWAQRREDLKRHNCMEYDPGMRQDYERNIERAERELDKKVDATIEREIEKLGSRGKEALAKELAGGAEVEVVRN